MTDSPQATDATAHSFTQEVRLLVDLARLCRVTLLYGDPGAPRDRLLRSGIVPLLQAARAGGQQDLVIVFDDWGEAPMAALLAQIRVALAQITTEPILDSASGQPFADVLRSWQKACNATFLIIFDRFNEYLIAPSGDGALRKFEDEFVQAANDATLRANFLLVLDQNAEPRLKRLRERIPSLGNDFVRLSSVTLPAEQPLEFPRTDTVFTAAPEVEQLTGHVQPMGAAASETLIQRPEFANTASLRSRKGRTLLALAIVVLVCAVAGAGVWFAQRAPQSMATMREQRASPSPGVPENAGEHPTPAKAPAAEEPPRQNMEKAIAQSGSKPAPPKPTATVTRASKAPAGPIKDKPKAAPTPPRLAPTPALKPPEPAVQPPKPAVPPSEPTRAKPAPAVQPPSTLDQVYVQRAAKECAPGVLGVVCREKIRHQLCAGKWTQDELPGMTRCYLW